MAETNNNNDDDTQNFLKYPSFIDQTTCPFHHPTYTLTPTNNNITQHNFHNFPSKKQKISTKNTTINNDNNNPPKVFQCQFCPRNFKSYKALGGHQNAHRRERAAARAGTLSLSFPQFLPPTLSPPFSPSSSSSGSQFGYVHGHEGYFGNFVDETCNEMVPCYGPPITAVYDGGFGEVVNNDGGNIFPDDVNLDLTLGTF